MVLKRFSYSAVLCGLILGNSMLALTPGKRARIMDLTKDIQNKNVSPTEARKRALAINISPKDMNDSKINELIMTAEMAGIADILNPVMAAETKTAVITAPVIKPRPIAPQEKPVLQQETVLIEDIKPDVIKEPEVTKSSEQPASKEIPAQLKEVEKQLKALSEKATNFLNKASDTITQKARDINDAIIEKNKPLIVNMEDDYDNIRTAIENLKKDKVMHKAIDMLSEKVSALVDDTIKAYTEMKAINIRNKTIKDTIEYLEATYNNLNKQIQSNVTSYSEENAKQDRETKNLWLDNFNNKGLNIQAHQNLYSKDIYKINMLAPEIESNIRKLLEMNKKAAEKKAAPTATASTPPNVTTTSTSPANTSQLNTVKQKFQSILDTANEMLNNKDKYIIKNIQSIEQLIKNIENNYDLVKQEFNALDWLKIPASDTIAGNKLKTEIETAIKALRAQYTITKEQHKEINEQVKAPITEYSNKIYTQEKILALMNAIPAPKQDFALVYQEKQPLSKNEWNVNTLKTFLKDNFVIPTDMQFRNNNILMGYYATKRYQNQFRNNQAMLAMITEELANFLNTYLVDGGRVVDVIKTFEEQFNQKPKIITQPTPTTTAGIVPNVTTTGVSTDDETTELIDLYPGFAQKKYTTEQLQGYATRLKEKGNKVMIELPRTAFEPYTDQKKEELIIDDLNKILDEVKNEKNDFNTKLYKTILPRYYLAKQRLAFYPSQKGQALLEKVLETSLKNTGGITWKIVAYIANFDQGL